MNLEVLKECSRCHKKLKLNKFYKGNGKYKKNNYCRICKSYIMKSYYEANPDKKENAKQSVKKSIAKTRKETIFAYGGKCKCCGEIEIEFLSLDHINGAKDRLDQLYKGKREYYMLKKKGYPKGKIQILCMNCNWAIGRIGYCPHKDKYIKQIVNAIRIK